MWVAIFVELCFPAPPARSPFSHPRVQPRLWTHPGPRSRAQTEPAAGGIAKPATSKPPLGGQLLRIPRSVALLGPCLIQSLESVQSQGKEQKEKPLVKAVFSGVCT